MHSTDHLDRPIRKRKRSKKLEWEDMPVTKSILSNNCDSIHDEYTKCPGTGINSIASSQIASSIRKHCQEKKQSTISDNFYDQVSKTSMNNLSVSVLSEGDQNFPNFVRRNGSVQSNVNRSFESLFNDKHLVPPQKDLQIFEKSLHANEHFSSKSGFYQQNQLSNNKELNSECGLDCLEMDDSMIAAMLAYKTPKKTKMKENISSEAAIIPDLSESLKTPINRNLKCNQQKLPLLSSIRKRLIENAYKTSPAMPAVCKTNEVILDDNGDSQIQSSLTSDGLATQDIGPFYGLPSKVKHLLEKLRGINDLYDWQKECLTRNEVKSGKNFVYVLPTSGGKTLVAEILIMKCLLCLKKNAILVLPYVAIVQEKIQSLSQFAVELGFLIEEYAGGKGKFPPRKRRKKNVLYVCTIEKANTLVNSLIENKRLDELKLMIVDEFHMIGEGGKRGATIELMLTKLLYLNASVQVIGMTATLANCDELSLFLKGSVYCNSFRPVKLDEYVKISDCVFKVDSCSDEQLVKERIVTHSDGGLQTYEANRALIDSDHLVNLVTEVIPQHSCLIFCPTKKSCENVALKLCQLLPRKFKQHSNEQKADLLKSLSNEDEAVRMCPILSKVIPYGVAYHHSGLTADERQCIEEAYRNEVLSVITCTSTLAAGVNLPARRVIIRSPHVGRDFMTRAQYRQMIGRAGRAGIDSKGESFLIAPKHEGTERIKDLVLGPMESCKSSLLFENGKGCHSLLLNAIALEIISTQSQASALFSYTLCARQNQVFSQLHAESVSDVCLDLTDSEKLSQYVNKCVQYLLDLQLVEKVAEQNNDVIYKPTTLGRATSKCGIEFDISNELYKNLKHGLEGMVLDTHLHLLYLVTPYDSPSNIVPKWPIYMREIDRLSASELAAASFIGVTDQHLSLCAAGKISKKKAPEIDKIVRRFYVTLILYSLLNGESVWEVSDRFEQPRGLLQSLLIRSAGFASCILRFSQEFEQFWPYQALLEKLIGVLQYCRISELVPLMEISSVKLGRAKQLFNAGYKSLAQVAGGNADAMVQNIEHLSRRQALQIIASAKVLLTEKIETLEEEVEMLKSEG